jgi:Holliday junction DNA helicase RuvA
MLSAMSVDELTMAIASSSTEMLTTIPGIGKKTAERLILELKDKVGAVMISTSAGRAAQENVDVINALVSLGYSVMEATRTVATLPASQKLTLEEKVKLALQYLGK